MSGYNPEVAGKIRAKDHFLQKPCSLETIAETVRQCLDENQ
jgi:hypothetical protein